MESEALSLRLRPANSDDVTFLTNLRNDLARYFVSQVAATEEKTRTLLQTPLAESRTVVAEQDGQRIGAFALYDIHGDTAVFGRFMVLPEKQGRGLGGRMLAIAVELAKRHQIRTLRLTVREGNAVATDLYTAYGFTRIQGNPEYLIMEKTL